MAGGAEELRTAAPSPALRIGTLRYVFFGLLQSFLPAFLRRLSNEPDQGVERRVRRLRHE
jgi:hypothetical protein